MRRTKRSRGVSVAVHPGGEVTVSAHPLVSISRIEDFLRSKESWIREKVAALKDYDPDLANHTKEHFLAHKERAQEVVARKIAQWNAVLCCEFNHCTIRRQRRAWGSCSRKRNLNFNYKICFLPEPLQDYIVVHELCHLKEMNHSPRFWAHMAACLPNCRELRRMLKKHR